jgi:hypothetical protein
VAQVMEFILLTLDGIRRWINIAEIAAMEEEGDKTIIYLKNNASVHVACDQDIDDIMAMINE